MFTRNSYYGIVLAGTSGNTIELNTLGGNGLDAIALANAAEVGGPASVGSTGNYVKTNTITSSLRDGIFIGENCNGNFVTDGNNISNVASIGISVWRPSGQTITDNIITGTLTGIRLLGSSNNTITGNAITGNGTGIKIDPSWQVGVWYQSLNNDISLNNISGNTLYNIQANDAQQTAVVEAGCNWWGTADYGDIFSKVGGNLVVYVPYLSISTLDLLNCNGGPATPASLALTYNEASENIIVDFNVTASDLELVPVPGLNPADPNYLADVTALYTNLAAAVVSGVQADIQAAALAIGDDIITEYYYMDGSNKVYLKTINNNDLVKNKYWDQYLVRTSDLVRFPNWGTALTLVETGSYRTATNPATFAVAPGWLDNVAGKDLYVTVTFIHNGSITTTTQSVAIPALVLPVLNFNTGLTYATIQEAINTASANDTIIVSAGTYTENVLINKPLTLNGANADIPFGTGRGPESIIQPATSGSTPLSLSGAGISDNVTINGFEITGPMSNNAIYCGGDGAGNLNIKFNYIHDIGTGRGSGNVYAINYRVNNPSTSNFNISDNYITNIFSNTTAALGHSAAIWLGQSTANGTVSDLTIERNTISNVYSGLSNKDASGIYIGVAWGTGTGSVVDPVIKDNLISNVNGGIAYGIQLSGKTPGAEIIGNIINNVSGLPANPSNATGISVPVTNTGSASISINLNSITNVPYYIFSGTQNILDATCNWWGTADYGDIFSKMSGSKILYVPYLTSDVLVPASCNGGPATPASLALTYNEASENIIVDFNVTASDLELVPVPGLNPADPNYLADVTALYTNLAAAVVSGIQADIQAAALAIGDDIITEYYYMDGSNKVYLKTINNNDLVKNKYWDQYLVRTSDLVRFPNWGAALTLVETGSYRTSTNPATGAVTSGWLDNVAGNDLYVTVTFIHNGSITTTTQSVAIPALVLPVLNVNTGLTYATIQEAINAATAGDTIHASAGNYVENIVVNRPLTVRGDGMSSTVLYPALSAPGVAGGSSMPPGASHVIIIQANDVTIQNMTIDGDNPLLTSGTILNGADVDARNGIITNHTMGVYNNVNVNHVEVKNIFQRGIYNSSGGTFNISYNTLDNIGANGIMNWAATGIISHNTLSNCSDGINSNHSKGTEYFGNIITNCGTGIHSDNNGSSGGIGDKIYENTISNGSSGSYGIFVYASYRDILVEDNIISNVEVGFASAASYSVPPATITVNQNSIDGQMNPNSMGIYTTTEIWGYQSGNQNTVITNNNISNNGTAFFIASEAGYTNTTTANLNSITGNATGVILAQNYTGGNPTGTLVVDLTCNWWGSADYGDIFPLIPDYLVFVPYLTSDALVPASCNGGPATPANLALTYAAGAESILVEFDVTESQMELLPVPGLNPADPDYILQVTTLYNNLAAAVASGVQSDIQAAALAIGDDIITEYYYMDGSNKVYLKTINNNDLVKNKYWDQYLVRSDLVRFPNWGSNLSLIEIDNYRTSTNPATFAVSTGWLNAVMGKDLYVTVTFIHNGNITTTTQSVAIPMSEAVALTYVIDNTTLTGTLDNLTATFPPSIPPVIVAEPYKINSRITLAQALPAGTTVTIERNGNIEVYNWVLPGVGPFWYTDLIPGATPADFDGNYGGAVENYVITVTGPGTEHFVCETDVLIESIISKDGFTTNYVLADIIVPAVISNTSNTTTITECDSYEWPVTGLTYTTSGIYTDVQGCHTEILNLTITPSTTNTTVDAACDSYVWTYNGQTYNATGIYEVVTGCHTEILNLTITPSTTNTTVDAACDSYVWTYNGQTYNATGIYEVVTGCHTEILNLTITPSTTNTTVDAACDSYVWTYNGQTYNATGIYEVVTGCHTEILNLTITPSTTNTTVDAACDSYVWTYNGQTYNATGIYEVVTGCHTEILNLTITPSTTNTTVDAACDSYVWTYNGQTYNATGIYEVVTGCHTEILNLTITPSTTNTTVDAACDSYVWTYNGQTYNATGIYEVVTGCHTEILNLTITPSTTNTTVDAACDSYVWTYNGQTYNATGIYEVVTGCHTEILNLTITPSTTNTTVDAACDSYVWTYNGQTYNATGIYEVVTGCHTEILNLTITPSTTNTTVDAACDSYVWTYNGQTYNATGIYEVVTGCHTEILNLTITPSTTNTTVDAACDSYVWTYNGQTYNATGIYEVVTGCHTEILNLTITPSTTNTTVDAACDSYVWTYNGQTYNATGIYEVVTGCHTEILNLTITPSTTNTTVDAACDSYVWTYNGQTYNATGIYEVVTGCHTEILNLTITPSTTNTTVDAACDSYVWTYNGQTYNATGIYEVVTGCHTEILELTVNNSYTQTVCDIVTIYDIDLPYIWNGQSLISAGQYTAVLQTIHGCDSTVCLDLIVKAYLPLSVSKNIGTAVLAEWIPVSGATLYRLKYRQIYPVVPPPFNDWIPVTQSTQTLRKIVGLNPGTTYELLLEYRIGISWFSAYAPIEFTTNVINFSTTNDIGTKFKLDWTEIDDVSSYILQLYDPILGWKTRGYYPTNTAVLGEMLEGVNYQFRVCPRYNEVSFDWTQTGTVTSNYIVLNIDNFDGTSADVSWDDVTIPDASDYILQVRVQNNQTASSWNNYYSPGTYAFIYNMTSGVNYECRLIVRYGGVAWGATSWRLITGNKQETVEIIPQNNLNVYPNPVSDLMTIEVNSTATSSHVWNLYDANGKLVMSGSESLTEGLNYFFIDATQLSTGLYMLQSTFNGTVESTRIIKQ
jgi:parallel beta-helix repeat protein